MAEQLAFDFPDLAPAPVGGPFRMECWHDGRWESMEEGPGRRVWKPRRTVQEAAAKCVAWTGLIAIPAMQVVDVETGEVVWRDSAEYPDAGEPILPEWDAAVRDRVRAVFAAEREAEEAMLRG